MNLVSWSEVQLDALLINILAGSKAQAEAWDEVQMISFMCCENKKYPSFNLQVQAGLLYSKILGSSE